MVAHQAPGEVFAVTLSGAVIPSGGVTSGTTGTSDAAAALAANSTAATVGAAADTMANITTTLQMIALNVGAIGGSSTAAAGFVNGTNAGANGLINGVYWVNGQPANGTYNGIVYVNGTPQASQGQTATQQSSLSTTGTTNTVAGGRQGALPTADQYQQQVSQAMAQASAAGVPWDGSVPWDGFTGGKGAATPAASLPVASVPGQAPSTGSGGASTSALTVNIDMRGSMVGNQSQMLQAVTAAVQKGLTGNLFAAGARLTQ